MRLSCLSRSPEVRLPTLSILLLAVFLSSTSTLAQKPDKPGSLKFRGASFPVAEEAGEVEIVVKRLGGSDGEVSVNYEVLAGTATDGDDYVSTSGTLTWPDGDKGERSFAVEILDDLTNEGQESFGVRLFDPSGGATLGNPSQAVVRIKPSDRPDDGGGDDDGEDGEGEDPEPGVLRLTASNYPAFEASEVAEVTVERIGGSEGAVMVEYLLVPGSAELGSDFEGTGGTVSWADGEDGEKSFEVSLVDDAESEGLETINIVLTAAEGGAELGSRDVGSIMIIDDDGGAGRCVPDATTLCLKDGRFQVTGTWTDFEGNQGNFSWIPATDTSGLAWFFSAENVELLFKVLNGCPVNGHHWVFYAATTNVAYQIEVTDLATGDVKTYDNPLGVAALAITDVTAFNTCE